MLFEEIKSTMPKCSACKSYDNSKHSYCDPIGKGRKLAFVTDDFSLSSKGQWLSDRMESHIVNLSSDLGLDFSRDVQVIPAFRCDGKHKPVTASYCRFQMELILKDLKARSVVLLGKNALINVVGNMWKRDIGEMDKWRGFTIPINGKWIVPTYNPFEKWGNKEYMEDPVTNRALNRDITAAYNLMDTPIPELQPIAMTLSPKEGANFLNNLLLNGIDPVAFDYETTGLRPYNKGHEIVSVSFAHKLENDSIFSCAFLVTEDNRSLLRKFLSTGSIRKIASNMKFEDTWGKVLLGVQTKGWFFDTMLAQHILDGREGICSLKFQAFVRYGAPDYEKDVKPYLTADNGDEFNKIRQCDYNKLLYYNALDSWYEYKLAMDMMGELDNDVVGYWNEPIGRI